MIFDKAIAAMAFDRFRSNHGGALADPVFGDGRKCYRRYDA
jgi:hypothetical protein